MQAIKKKKHQKLFLEIDIFIFKSEERPSKP